MKNFLFILLVCCALSIEWIVSPAFSLWGFSPSFTVLVLLLWFWGLTLQARIWISIIIGFIFDSLLIVPFGTHIFLFLVGAFVIEAVHMFLSETSSKVTETLNIVAVFFFLFLLLPFAVFAASGFEDTSMFVTRFLVRCMVAGFIWSLISIPFAALIIRFTRK